ncbi:MAG: hypothetical protein LBP22_04490 [Deltaproteobacteria bacterium]|nr:hypothetical protein [Deltaproteobacteria bacterium]
MWRPKVFLSEWVPKSGSPDVLPASSVTCRALCRVMGFRDLYLTQRRRIRQHRTSLGGTDLQVLFQGFMDGRINMGTVCGSSNFGR